MKFYKGKYTLKNPQKYIGDPTNVIYRSSWELKFLVWCDKNPNVVSFSSEEVVIPYVCPTDNRRHRYFVDFLIKVRDKSGNIKTYLIEIKPSAQTKPPEIPKRKTRRYIQEVFTWGKNEAKWKAAIEYAKDRGWEFKILTEHELGLTNK
jgi:hypothetical protein